MKRQPWTSSDFALSETLTRNDHRGEGEGRGASEEGIRNRYTLTATRGECLALTLAAK